MGFGDEFVHEIVIGFAAVGATNNLVIDGNDGLDLNVHES